MEAQHYTALHFMLELLEFLVDVLKIAETQRRKEFSNTLHHCGKINQAQCFLDRIEKDLSWMYPTILT